MRSSKLRLSFFAALVLLETALLVVSAFADEAQLDSTGISIPIPKTEALRPKRIVTLAPSLGELAAELLETDIDRIVGVSEYTDEPSILAKKPKVGGYNRIQIEKVLSLEPDLVLATQDGNSKDQIDHLRERKIPVVVVRSESFEDLFKSIEWVSKSMGLDEAGARLGNRLKTGLGKMKERADRRKAKEGSVPLKVLLQVGTEPFVVAGSRSFLTSALEWLGAVNIYGNSKDHYPRPTLEDAVSHNPDFILIMSLGTPNEDIARAKKEWQRFKSLPAVQKDQVKILRADALLRPTGRFLEGISILEKSLYGKP